MPVPTSVSAWVAVTQSAPGRPSKARACGPSRRPALRVERASQVWPFRLSVFPAAFLGIYGSPGPIGGSQKGSKPFRGSRSRTPRPEVSPEASLGAAFRFSASLPFFFLPLAATS